MVRMSKQGRKRNTSPRRSQYPAPKTGAKKQALPKGYKEHDNALEGELQARAFIPKIKVIS